MTDLTRDDMIDGLRELVRELHALGEAGGVRIVGGAAMLLRYCGERRVTPDIDAKLHPEAPAIRIAEQIARRRGWNEGLAEREGGDVHSDRDRRRLGAALRRR